MKVDKLRPLPDRQTQFAWTHHVTVPAKPGCYALVSFKGDVLYMGLASSSIQSRMGTHLDTPDKRKTGVLGVPFWFYYVIAEATEVNRIERGWMNQALLEDGAMPLLNKVYSPL